MSRVDKTTHPLVTEPSVGNALWAQVAMTALYDAGVRDLVVSPGSRSTPFVIAAVSSPLRLHTAIDERSAAFFALGITRARGLPCALLCTSGTAGAHYLPALLEARYSELPLIAMTADRPPELHNCGALQTIDQRELFAAARKQFVDLGCARSGVDALAALRATVLEAVHQACEGPQGVVHINAPARKPLEPQPHEDAHSNTADAPGVRPPTRLRPSPPAATTELPWNLLATELADARRALIVCGPSALRAPEDAIALTRLSQTANLLVCCEATSQLRFNSDGNWQRFDSLPLVGATLADQAPEPAHIDLSFDVVVRIGATPTSPILRELPSQHTWVVARYGAPDPSRTAQILASDVPTLVKNLVPALHAQGGARKQDFNRVLRFVESLTWDAVETSVDNRSEPAMVRATLAAMAGGTLLLGNSLPVREIDLFCPGTGSTCRILSQRGVAGIDGLLAGAAGIATATPHPIAVLLGDVSFCHDVGSLALCAQVPVPLFVVVLDNGGGRIFDELPVGKHRPRDFEKHWTTAPSLDFAAIARAFGLSYAKCETSDDVSSALSNPTVGTTLVHCNVAPNSFRTTYHKARAALASRLAQVPNPPVSA